MKRLKFFLPFFSFVTSCRMVDEMYESSGTGVTMVAVGLTVILIVYFLGRLNKKSK